MEKNTSNSNLLVPVWPVYEFKPIKKILKAAAGCNIIYTKGKAILQE